MKKYLLPVLVLLFCVSSVAAQRNRSGLSYVPGKSVAVLQVNWQSVRGDETLKNMVRGGEFAQIADHLGVRENNVREFIIFLDVNPTDNNKMGMIISGNFTSQQIIKAAKSKDLKTEKFGERTAYINPADNSYFLPIGNGMLLAGTKNGVTKTLATITDPTMALIKRANFSSIFKQLGRNTPIRFFIGVPQEYQKAADFAFKITTKLMSFTSLGLMGTIFDKIGLIQSLGFSISRGTKSMPVQLIAEMPDATRATVGAGALNWLKSLSLKTNVSSQDKEAINSLIVGSKGKLISVKMNMPKNALITR